MRQRINTWIQSITTEKTLLFLFHWLTGACFLIFFTFSTDFLYSFSFLRNSLFRVIVYLLLFIYILLFSLNRSYRPRITSAFVVLLLLFFTFSLSALVNGSLLNSFWGDMLRMDGLFSFGHYIIFVLVVSSVFRTFNDWQKVFQMILWVSFISAFFAFSQFIQHPLLIESAGGSRISSTFGNVSYYAFFQTIGFFLSLYVAVHPRLRQLSLLIWFFVLADIALIVVEAYSHLYVHQSSVLRQLVGNLYLLIVWLWPQFWLLRFRLANKPWQRWIAVGSMLLLQLAAIWFSGARTALIATIIGLLAVSVIWLLMSSLSYRVKLISLSIAAFVTVVITILKWSSVATIAHTLAEYNSFNDRLVVWGISWRAFLNKPFIGWGPENFLLAFNHFYDDQLFRSGVSPIWYDKAHNIFIQYAVDGGGIALIGFLILWILIVRSFRHLWIQRPAERVAWSVLAVLGAVYSILGLFYFDTINNQVFFYIILAYIWSREAELNHTVKKYGLPLRVPFGRPIFFSLITIISILFTYNFYFDTIVANYAFSKELKSMRPDISAATPDKLSLLRMQAAKAPTLGKSELRYQYVLLVSDLITYGTGLTKDQLLDEIRSAESVLKKNISKRPSDLETYVQLCNFYLLAGRVDAVYWERGLSIAQQIQEDNPERTQFLYLVGQMNLALGRAEVGLEAFHQAALRRPDVMDTHIQYYKQLSNVGKLQEAGDYFDANISRAPDGDVVAICKYDITTGRLELAQPHLALLEKRGSVPDQVAAMKTFLLLAQGNATEARKNAEQTVQRYPSTYAALAPYFADLRP